MPRNTLKKKLSEMSREELVPLLVELMRRLDDDSFRYAVGRVHRGTIGVAQSPGGESAEVLLLAPPDAEFYSSLNQPINGAYEDGTRVGSCARCDVLLTGGRQMVVCPLCGKPVELT